MENPREVFRAEHRIEPERNAWGEDNGLLMLTQQERIRRWRYAWLLDVDKATSRLWYETHPGRRPCDQKSRATRRIAPAKRKGVR